ncbi:S24 family peptidase [Paenibacillus silvae]|uniref:LexA family protein n=1 Tax=Paenibacillus silvae TaxID=1325358 RepID=UPI0025A1ACD3|nr:LexA family transcriptional regulator [Paenibacillus silvae]MDM5278831.1 S24 family peptidase [Paenibacillus silvae]
MGDRMKKLRTARGYTQNQMAEFLNMKPANVSSYERNRSIPPGDVLGKIADILQTSTDYLICRTDINLPIDLLVNRNTNYTPSENLTPLIGTICAGNGLIADSNIEDYVIYPFPKKKAADFALKVKGDSMIGAGINDGDVVFLKKGNWAEYNGQIVAVVINGEDGSLKRMRWTEGSPYIQLIPENSDYETKEVLPNEIVVCGLYAGHFKFESQ